MSLLNSLWKKATGVSLYDVQHEAWSVPSERQKVVLIEKFYLSNMTQERAFIGGVDNTLTELYKT